MARPLQKQLLKLYNLLFCDPEPIFDTVALAEIAQTVDSVDQLASKSELPLLLDQDKIESTHTEVTASAVAHLDWGDALFEQGLIKEAIDHYHQAIELNSEYSEAFQHLAEALTEWGDLTEAAICYQKAIDLASSVDVSVADRRQAQPDKIVLVEASSIHPIQAESLENAAQDSSWFEEASFYVQQASAHCDAGSWVKAIEACDQAIEDLGSETATLYLIKGQALQGQAKLEEATQAYQIAASIEPQWAEIHARLGSVWVEQKQFEQAVMCYQQAIVLEPEFAGAYWKLAEAHWQLGHLDQAALTRYTALRLEPSWASDQEHLQLGELLLKQGKLEQAIACYRGLLDRNPDYAEAYHGLGEALVQFGQAEEGVLCHCKAVELSPQNALLQEGLSRSLMTLKLDNIRHYTELGQRRVKQEQWDEALPCYQKLAELQPDQASVWHELGDILSRLFHWSDAAEAFRCAISLNPNFSWSYNNLGDALMHLEQWQEAADCYRRAIELNPEFHWSHYNLGEVLVKLEEWDGAIAAYRRAIELEPNSSQTLQKLHQVLHKRATVDLESVRNYYRQGVQHNQNSMEFLHQAITIEPKNPELYASLAKALERKNELEHAQIFYQIALQLQAEHGQAISKNSVKEESELPNISINQGKLALNKTYDDPILETISKEFDIDFYLSENPDVKEVGIDPIYHYCLVWREEFKNPTRWFNTKYYLETNPDVRKTDTNPFWHYLVVGRAEGRFPKQPGGYRREIIEALISPVEKTKHYSYPNTIFQITFSRLVSVLRKVCTSIHGVVISTSHDCYIKSVGGTQIFISDEQKKFNADQYTYIHVSPLITKLTLADDELTPFWVQIVINGEHIGITTYEELGQAIQELESSLPSERLFLVHCVLGHQVSGLIHLQKALDSSANYFWLHDYSSLCVGYNLLRNDTTYCGAGNSSSMGCRVCIYGEERISHLANVQYLFTTINFHVISPSAFTLDRWQKSSPLPHLSAFIHEHCQVEMTAYRREVNSKTFKGTHENPIRVAYLGYPSVHKGWPIFLNLVDKAQTMPTYKFYHFGSQSSLQTIYGIEGVDVSVTPDSRNSMIEALVEKSIDIVLVLSPWPETFSYVTHEAFASGAAVITLIDSGNVADAVRRTGWGTVVQDEEDLIDYFLSHKAVQFVLDRSQKGIEVGSLIYSGTTASLVIPVETSKEAF